jgi:electron transfer flavoprotein beta subunit
MRILVCVKHVPDTTEIRFDPVTKELRLRQAPTKINNYDEHALEVAVRLREQLGAEVVIACIGPEEAGKTMKTAVAAGADRAVLVTGPWAGEIDPAGTSALLAGLARSQGPFDLILSGDVSEDGYHSLVPGILAAALGSPFIRGVTGLTTDGASVLVNRQADGVEETYRVQLPAVLSVSSALNEPRTVTTLQVMKVSMSKVAILHASDVGLDDALFQPQAAATRIVGIRPAAQPRRQEVLTGEPDDVVQKLISNLEIAGVLS